MARYRLGIDVGGTFTDIVALNEENGEILNIKISSTPEDPAKAVVEAFHEFLMERGGWEVSRVIHATTVATNALLGQLGLELPRTALIATRGFRDVLEIGRQRRHKLYDLFIQRPRPLIPRNLRFEVDERIGPRGEIIEPLNEDQVKRLGEKLKKENIKSVAVALLFSYINQKHERRIEKILKKLLPRIYISISSDIAPEYREYERTSTAVVNAILMPIVSSYLIKLQRRMRGLGVRAPLCVMQSDGGIALKDVVSKRPISMVESGPAAGVIASAFYGSFLGLGRILSFDMGGTTAKAGAVIEGKPEIVSEYEVAGEVHSGRIVKGSGYPVRYPFIDLAECSAGGGTIAWVDEGKALQVGPISAGATPGPACYGKGGRHPTVTDANLVLGRLNPNYLLGGEMKIYPELSEKAILNEICQKIRLELTEAANGIIKITNSAMSKILRIVSVERGHDPRDFVLICFGGAGPMHGCALAEELNIKKIIVPPNPGLFSAHGLLMTDFKTTLIRAVMKLMDEINVEKIEDVFQKLEFKCARILEKQNISKNDMYFIREMDLRYFGQSYELTVPASKPFTEDNVNQTVESFHEKHMKIYGYAVREEPVELVNVRINGIGFVEKPRFIEKHVNEEKPSSDAIVEKRKVFFEKIDDYIETPVYKREKLKPGNLIEGPAVIEQYDTTTVVYPGWMATVDKFENLVISMKGGAY
ncbi:hydantoinase/oxoprolinase family protein [Candidatus Bathyarchaeota archaeon]|nr:hydantoinase/oxoprolinase family protein [Candidatus Bathyarchaeota archaeon]